MEPTDHVGVIELGLASLDEALSHGFFAAIKQQDFVIGVAIFFEALDEKFDLG